MLSYKTLCAAKGYFTTYCKSNILNKLSILFILENLLQNNYSNGSIGGSTTGSETGGGPGPGSSTMPEPDDPGDGLGPLPPKWETAYTERGELYFIE